MKLMARLPIPGGDDNVWGSILNDYLLQSHTNDGLLKPNTVGNDQLLAGSVVNSKLATGAVTNDTITDGTISEPKLDANVQTKLNSIAPVTSVNGQTGDVVLDKSDVGLGNVDNTSDANKPISTATQTALNAKANTSTVINSGTGLTGGGDLSADRTLSVVDDTTNQQLRISDNGSLVGTRREINFVPGSNISFTTTDNIGDNRVDVEIASSGGGASPGNTVVDETAYGQASDAGTSANFAREDHTHGTPPLTNTAPATTLEIGTAGAVGVATEPARADHVHPMAPAGTPGSSAVGDVASAGVATTFAASDHVHARESFGAVTPLTAFNTPASNGVSNDVARADHVHGAPALGTVMTKTADQASVSATYADITNLGLSVGIGSYEFNFLIPYTGSVSNGSGIKLRLNGPAASFISYNIRIQQAFTGQREVHKSAFADEDIGIVVVTANNTYTAQITGRVTTTAAGTLQPQFGITTGGTTTTVKAGAYSTLQAF